MKGVVEKVNGMCGCAAVGGQTRFWETLTFPQGEEESRGEGGRAETRGGERGK